MFTKTGKAARHNTSGSAGRHKGDTPFLELSESKKGSTSQSASRAYQALTNLARLQSLRNWLHQRGREWPRADHGGPPKNPATVDKKGDPKCRTGIPKPHETAICRPSPLEPVTVWPSPTGELGLDPTPTAHLGQRVHTLC